MNKFKILRFHIYLKEKVFSKVDKKIWTYAIFVVIATVIWFFNKLDQNYNTTINYPVRYTNLPANKYLVNELPKTLKLSVDAYGFTLLRYKLSPAPFAVPIDLSYFYNQIENSEDQFILYTRYVREDVNKEMPSNIEVLDILPDTIAFKFVDIINKKVPVVPITRLEFEEQCLLEGFVAAKPDSIEVSGPTILLDTLTGIPTKAVRFKRLSKTISKSVNLVELNDITLEQKKVDVIVPVAKYTQTKSEVEIITINVPDTLKLITFPSTTSISYMVSLSKFDKVKAGDFRVEVDYYDIKNRLGNKLPLRIKVTPDHIQSVSQYPTHVEFVLEKK